VPALFLRTLPRCARRVVSATLIIAAATALGAAPGRTGTPAAEKANQPQNSQDAITDIKELIAEYAAAVNAEPLNIELASRLWENSPEVSLVFPLGREDGWEQVKKNFYEGTMEAFFSERKLVPRDIRIHAYGDAAWAEFSWHFTAKLRKDGSTIESDGRETQIYRKVGLHHWVLVHVHYSGLGPGERPNPPSRP